MASGARWLAGVGLVVAAVVAGCGGDEEPAPEVSVDLYFTSGEQFHKVTRELAAEGSEVEMATEALLAGPTEAERTAKVPAQTTIPDGVELVDASLDDGVAHVGLSERFLAGVPGIPATGPASSRRRSTRGSVSSPTRSTSSRAFGRWRSGPVI